MEVLINLRRLERLDKDEFTEEERQEAEEIYEQRRSEEMAQEVGGHDRIKFGFLYVCVCVFLGDWWGWEGREASEMC